MALVVGWMAYKILFCSDLVDFPGKFWRRRRISQWQSQSVMLYKQKALSAACMEIYMTSNDLNQSFL